MNFFLIFAAVLVATCYGDNNPNASQNNICKRRNEYISIEGSCDSYIECRDYTSIEMICPDGLNFNPVAKFPDFPCGYPIDVPCRAGSVSHPKRPTSDCPRQYGIFPSPVAQPGDCGRYRMCIEGLAFDMSCPAGLAFNPVSTRCDWPDQVPSCNSDDFLGFVCPPAAEDASGNPLVTNHKYENDCYAFFSCQQGKARLLACDMGLAFDEFSGHCVDADKVPCSSMLYL